MSTSNRLGTKSIKSGTECSQQSGIAYSVYRLTTCQTVRGSNPGGGGGAFFSHPSKQSMRPALSLIQQVPGHSQG